MSENKKNVRKTAQKGAEKPAAPKKNSAKRWLLAAVAVVALAALGWVGFSLFGNNYKKMATEMKVNTLVAQRLAIAMLTDYQDNWLRMETEQLGKNDKGEWVSTSDPKQIIAWRQQFFKQNGADVALQNLLGETYAGQIPRHTEQLQRGGKCTETIGSTHQEPGRLAHRHVLEHG